MKIVKNLISIINGNSSPPYILLDLDEFLNMIEYFILAIVFIDEFFHVLSSTLEAVISSQKLN